jgi:molybdopterin converting factor small subunit
MLIRLTAFGELREHFGKETHEIELPTGATLADLLVCVEERWGDKLPASLWNDREHRFRGPVVIRVGERVTRDRTAVLSDGQGISFYRALVGG